MPLGISSFLQYSSIPILQYYTENNLNRKGIGAVSFGREFLLGTGGIKFTRGRQG